MTATIWTTPRDEAHWLAMRSEVVSSSSLGAGVHPGISPQFYHSDTLTPTPAMSAGMAIKLITDGPARAWCDRNFRREPKRCMEFGTAAHLAFLEPERLSDAVVILPRFLPDRKTGEGREVNGYTTLDARTIRDNARAAGKAPLLWHEAERLGGMARALRNELPVPFKTAPDRLRGIFTGGMAEVTVVAGGDPWLKARPDYVHFGDECDILVDFKVTGFRSLAAVQRFARNCFWDVRAAFYLFVWRQATGRNARYLFVVQESDPPHFVYDYELDEYDMRLGAARVEDAIGIYRDCIASGHWCSDVEETRLLEVNEREEIYG